LEKRIKEIERHTAPHPSPPSSSGSFADFKKE